MIDTVKFDPGFGELVFNFNDFINEVYSQLMSFRTIHQKRTRFKLYTSKIQKYMQNNIAFYYGCLLWAYYIYNENKNSPKIIEGNIFLDLQIEQKKSANYDYMMQVNFMENYFDSFERDILYYTGQKAVIPIFWKNILALYSEFLEKNKGFVSTKTTSDIILPDKMSNITAVLDIKNLIDRAILEKNLDLLLDVDIFTLKA